MFLKNPRIAAITKKIQAMDIDALCEHVEIYKLDQEIRGLIYDNFAKRKGFSPDLADLMTFVSVRNLLRARISNVNTIQEIKTFLINYLKGRDNEGRTENQVGRSVQPSEPGRIEV